MNRSLTLLGGAALLVLAGCMTGPDGRELPAGAWIDEGGFGNPTLVNHHAQTCPPVRHRAAGKHAGKGYQVQGCAPRGHAMDGRYAEIVRTEHIGSATAPHGEIVDVDLIESGAGD